MIKIDSSSNIPIIKETDDKNKKKENKEEINNNTNTIKKDELKITSQKNNNSFSNDIKLFNDKDKPKNNNDAWKVKSVHINAGYILNNTIPYSGPMHIKNDEQNTDLTISNYKQKQRTSFEYLTMKNGTRFAPDEPQFIIGVNTTFNNNFGIELDAKHNKVIMDGYDQEVDFSGKLNGEDINTKAPLNTYMQQHEQTFGNMQISALATYNLDLPAPGNHKFSFITKAGPSIIATTTRTNLRQPNGDFDGNTSKLQVSGWGASVETGLRYQFGPKVKGLGLELTNTVSYLNYSNSRMVNNTTGSHDAIYNAISLKATINLFDNKK